MEYEAEYLSGHEHLPQMIPVRERVIYVHPDPPILSLRRFDCPKLDTLLIFDFDPFISTVRFA